MSRAGPTGRERGSRPETPAARMSPAISAAIWACAASCTSDDSPGAGQEGERARRVPGAGAAAPAWRRPVARHGWPRPRRRCPWPAARRDGRSTAAQQASRTPVRIDQELPPGPAPRGILERERIRAAHGGSSPAGRSCGHQRLAPAAVAIERHAQARPRGHGHPPLDHGRRTGRRGPTRAARAVARPCARSPGMVAADVECGGQADARVVQGRDGHRDPGGGGQARDAHAARGPPTRDGLTTSTSQAPASSSAAAASRSVTDSSAASGIGMDASDPGHRGRPRGGSNRLLHVLQVQPRQGASATRSPRAPSGRR